MKTDQTRMRLLRVAEILKDKSDRLHPLQSSEIIEELSKYGITAERKAIYGDIEALERSGLDIIRTSVPKKGFCLGTRSFELPEICLLIDAVQSAGFIPKKSTERLIGKLRAEVSAYDSEAVKNRVCIMNRSKSDNDGIYEIIEVLNTAITRERKVKLVYSRHVLEGTEPKTVEKEMTVSPYALLWEADHYYLIGNNEKYDNLMNLRIDRIRNAEVTDIRSRHFSEVSEYKQRFDTADYAKKAFNMFGGEMCRIDLECDIRLLQQITDRFSDGIFIRHGKDEPTFRFSADAMLSDGLVGWIMQFGGDVRVLSPEILRRNVLEKAKKLTEAFEKKP